MCRGGRASFRAPGLDDGVRCASSSFRRRLAQSSDALRGQPDSHLRTMAGGNLYVACWDAATTWRAGASLLTLSAPLVLLMYFGILCREARTARRQGTRLADLPQVGHAVCLACALLLAAFGSVAQVRLDLACQAPAWVGFAGASGLVALVFSDLAGARHGKLSGHVYIRALAGAVFLEVLPLALATNLRTPGGALALTLSASALASVFAAKWARLSAVDGPQTRVADALTEVTAS